MSMTWRATSAEPYHPGPRLPRVWSLGARRGVTHVAVVQSTQRAGISTGGSPVAVSTNRHDRCELCRNPVPRIVTSVQSLLIVPFPA